MNEQGLAKIRAIIAEKQAIGAGHLKTPRLSRRNVTTFEQFNKGKPRFYEI